MALMVWPAQSGSRAFKGPDLPESGVGSIPTGANQFGWCNKDRLVPSAGCKPAPLGQEVRFRPPPTIIPRGENGLLTHRQR